VLKRKSPREQRTVKPALAQTFPLTMRMLLAERRWAVGAAYCSLLTLLACPKVPEDTGAVAACESDGDAQCDDGDDDDGPGGGVISGGGSGGSSGSANNGGSSGEGGDDGYGGYGSDGPDVVIGGGSAGSDSGDDGTETQGEVVVTAFDAGSRQVGRQHIVFNGDRVFWTRDQDDRLGIFSASLSGPLPAEPETLLDSEWFPSSGWSHPPLLVTSTHIMLPIIGTIDAGNGFVDTDGFATLSRDGSELQLARFEAWWLAGHGANVVMPADSAAEQDVPHEINLATGAATPVPNFINGEECVYDAVRDERACLWYGQLNAYSFATGNARLIVESPSIVYGTFGTPRLSFNSNHWFVAHALGLAAYPREGSGSPTYYRSIDGAAEAFATDDTSAFVCMDNDMVRVSLADETHETLTHGDCESSSGLGSVIGMDATYIYYLGARQVSYGAQPVDIRRIARTAPGTPRPAPAD